MTHSRLVKETRGSLARWPGFDWDFYRMVRASGLTSSFRPSIEMLNQRYTFSGQKPFPFGPPVIITREFAARLDKFCNAYHRMIEAIVQRYPKDRVLLVSRRGRVDLSSGDRRMREAFRDHGWFLK